MAFMRRVSQFLMLASGYLLLAPALYAQDDPQPRPIVLGGFDLSGSATAGFRFEDVKGYAPQFQELINLGKGFRLLDFDLNGVNAGEKSSFADTFSLQLSGLGGDPFPSAQFMISKHKVYDLRVNWRQSYFYWNQNDNVVLPIAAAAVGLSSGGTSNHDWATVRKFGSVDLTLYATDHLRFRFNYYRPSNQGSTFTTRSPDFLGAPSFWGAFARANPYFLFAPLNDETNRFTGGVDYSVKDWNFHYSAGYQAFTENISLNNTTSPEVSINPLTSSMVTPLTDFNMSQFRRLTTPISEFSFLGRPRPKLEWRGGYIFYRYQGPATFDQSFSGIAPDATKALVPYTITQSGRANVTEPNHIVSQGFTYHLYSWWGIDLDYRYSRFTSDSVGNFSSLFNSTAATSAVADTNWRDGLHDLTLSMDFRPIPALIIRPGIQLLKSDVEFFEDGVSDPATSLRTKSVRPVISFGYDPGKLFSVRGDFHSMTSGSSYTAITPHTQQVAHFVVRIRPTAKFSIEDEVSFGNYRLLTTNFKNNIRTNGITVNYSLGERFSIFAGFSYESYFAEGDILYLRGTPPLANTLQDQEVNRVLSGGFEAKLMKRAGIRFSGNFDRSSGTGAITGEPPAYGPVTWPLATGSIYYDLPRAGRLAVDLQRTYYLEEIVTGNNFSANLLTIRWTKNF